MQEVKANYPSANNSKQQYSLKSLMDRNKSQGDQIIVKLATGDKEENKEAS